MKNLNNLKCQEPNKVGLEKLIYQVLVLVPKDLRIII